MVFHNKKRKLTAHLPFVTFVHSELFHGPDVKNADTLIPRTCCEIATVQIRREGEGLYSIFVLMPEM